ncbi:MAG: YbaB/EbfC family nucleoid-associated protein [Candidatus Omnitrophica bacterium]|nr:YbaB/EbfC family nucleoid-associated protein [Candidatus Omnitrophota bacterium]
MLDKLKDLYQAQKKMNEIKKKLEAIKIDHEVMNGKIKVEIDGTQRILSVKIDEEMLSADKKDMLQRQMVVCLNAASEKVQKIAAQQMQSAMGDLKLPGLS